MLSDRNYQTDRNYEFGVQSDGFRGSHIKKRNYELLNYPGVQKSSCYIREYRKISSKLHSTYEYDVSKSSGS